MKKIRRFVIIVALLCCLAFTAQASPIIFVVRHAEKAAAGGNDSDLSAAGQQRAEALATITKDAQLSAIFTTELKRTQQTAAPAAKATQLSPTVIPANDTLGLVAKLRALHGNALVVGHGNTIPELLKGLGIDSAISIADDDYTELLIVIMSEHPQLVRLRYPS